MLPFSNELQLPTIGQSVAELQGDLSDAMASGDTANVHRACGSICLILDAYHANNDEIPPIVAAAYMQCVTEVPTFLQHQRRRSSSA